MGGIQVLVQVIQARNRCEGPRGAKMGKLLELFDPLNHYILGENVYFFKEFLSKVESQKKF